MKKYILIASVVFLAACGGDKGKDSGSSSSSSSTSEETSNTQTVNKGDRFSMEIPNDLTETDKLNEAAALQYMNAVQELYAMVMEESQEEFYASLDQEAALEGVYSRDFEGYSKLLIENYYTTMSVNERTPLRDTVINKLPAKVVDLEANVRGLSIYYSIAFVNGASHFYQVMTWTLLNRKDTHQAAMRKMMYSFKELGGSGKDKKES